VITGHRESTEREREREGERGREGEREGGDTMRIGTLKEKSGGKKVDQF